MAIRIQLRRDTAANWISSNPVLRQGEMGIETDTLKIKLGDGTSTWTQITAYMNLVPDGNSTIGDYVMVTDIGAAQGVVGLDNNKNAVVTGSSIILEGATDNAYETTLTVIDPTADRTITFKNADGTVAFVADIPTTTDALTEGSTNKYFSDERAQDAVANSLAAGTHTNITVTYNDAANSLSLAAAPGYVDEQAVDAVAAALAAGTHTNISVSYNDAGNAISLTGAQTYNDENAQDAIGNNLGTGLSYNDPTGAISVNTSVIQARVANVDDTEIGYLDGVTSSIQTQLNSKAPIASPALTGVPTAPTAVSSTNTTQIATTEFVKTSVNNLINGAGAAYDTLKELSDLIIADESTASSLATLVGTKAPIASPTFTGTVSGITKTMVGLGNVDNTSDTAKPISTLTQAALDLKAPLASPTFTGTVSGITKTMVGLGNVDNTSDVSKPISTLTQAALDFKAPLASPALTGTPTAPTAAAATNTTQVATTAFVRGEVTALVNGASAALDTLGELAAALTADEATAATLATLVGTKAPIASPTFTGTVSGITKSMVGLGNVDNTSDTSKPISTATQTALDAKLASATAATTYETITNVALKAPLASPTFTGTVSGITKTMVGLDNVDNTTDALKPISTATQTALDAKLASATAATTYETITNVALKAPLASPALTGSPTAPTALAADNSTKIATTAYADRAASNATAALVASAPAALDTLNELAAALGNDALFSTTVTNSIATKAPIASPTFTGTVSGITKSMVGLGNVDNTSDANKPVSNATQTALDLKAPIASPTFTGTLVLPSTVNGPSASTSVNLLFPTTGGHITLGGSQTTGNLTIGGGTQRTTGVIGIGTGATTTGTKTINVGTGSTGGTTAITVGSADGATSNITLNGNVTLPSTTSIGDVSSTELSYLNNVTSAIQTQINAKAPIASPTFTGTVNLTYDLDVSGTIFSHGNLSFDQTSSIYTNSGWGEPGQILKTNGYGYGLSWYDIPVTQAATETTLGTVYGSMSDSTSNTSLGYNASTTSAYSTAIGTDANAVGQATALGRSAYATAYATTALGQNSQAIGGGATAIGDNSYAYAANTIAIGQYSDAEGAGAIALGNFATSLIAKQMVIGAPAGNATEITRLTIPGMGIDWTSNPIPSQTGNSGKYLTTNGSTTSWASLVVPITTGTATVNQNTAKDVDIIALSAFTSAEYMISIKQGSKIRTSKVIIQTDGTSVDMTEFAITETGGTLAGVVVSATTASSNAKLQVTVTDALSTNATVKFSKIAL